MAFSSVCYPPGRDIKNKIKKTNMKRYGFENASRNETVKAKIRKTCLDKYGVSCSLLSTDSINKSKQTCLYKYGHESYHSTSNVEQNQLLSWLNEYGCFVSNRTILNGKEIDFYNKDINLGIEYCGLYWHNELSPTVRGRLYHWDKYYECLEKNIRLITIFSDEWLLRQEQVKGFLLSVLQANKIIYARKCSVSTIDAQTSKEFIQRHHIQGCGRSPKVSFGLYKKDDLLGVLSLNLHHRDSSQYVLDRLVFKQGNTVIGGVSRLFKLACRWCVDNNIKQLVTWSDNRWSNGKIYQKLGFTLETESRPDYSYVEIKNPKKRISKQSMKKSKTGCPPETTERQWCINNGYGRIWDCGKKRFVFSMT